MNPFHFLIFLEIASFIDITLTIHQISIHAKVKGFKKAIELEVNEIAKWFWRKFGLLRGSVIWHSLIAFVILPILVIVMHNTFVGIEFIQGVCVGCYFLMNYMHLCNISYLEDCNATKTDN